MYHRSRKDKAQAGKPFGYINGMAWKSGPILLSEFINSGGYLAKDGWHVHPDMPDHMILKIRIEYDIKLDKDMPIEEQRALAKAKTEWYASPDNKIDPNQKFRDEKKARRKS